MTNSRAIALKDFFLHVNDATKMRLLRESDAEELYTLARRNHAHLHPWMAWVPDDGVKRSAIANFLREAENEAMEQTAYQTAVVSDGKIIGTAGFHEIDWENRLAHIGYWLDESHAGKGIMTAAVAALITYGFAALELNRIEIRCSSKNERSAGIARRLGFTLEGTLRQAYRVRDTYTDDHVFAMLADEWEARPASQI